MGIFKNVCAKRTFILFSVDPFFELYHWKEREKNIFKTYLTSGDDNVLKDFLSFKGR